MVAELKRDAAPDTVEMQALKYAAMASRFTPETLGHQHARFCRARGHPVTEEEALAALEDHADDKMLAVDTLRQPRPGEWVMYSEISEYTGRSRAQLRAGIGVITKLVRERFGKNSAPFEAPWLPDRGDHGFPLPGSDLFRVRVLMRRLR